MLDGRGIKRRFLRFDDNNTGYGSLQCRQLMKKADYFLHFILGFYVGLKNKSGSGGTSAGGESGESERHSHWLHEDQ